MFNKKKNSIILRENYKNIQVFKEKFENYKNKYKVFLSKMTNLFESAFIMSFFNPLYGFSFNVFYSLFNDFIEKIQ